MKNTSARQGVCIGCVVGLLGTATGQNLVQNGSFEEGFQSDYQRTIPQWTTGGSNNIYFHRGHGASDGVVAANFSSYDTPVGSVLSQTFATVPGETYYATFDAYARQYGGGGGTISFNVTGMSPRFAQTYALAGSSGVFFHSFGLSFLADSNAINIAFSDGGSTTALDAVLDNVVVTGPQHRVYGYGYLDGYRASVIGDLLEVEVWQNNTLVETLDGNYGPNGTFAFSPTVSGPAVLKFRFRTGLWKAVPVTLGPTPIENLTVNMINGDCDHDNEVGIGDYALLSAIYGLSVGDPGYDTNADLNGDTTVDIADYAILSGSYGEIGD